MLGTFQSKYSQLINIQQDNKMKEKKEYLIRNLNHSIYCQF